MLDSWWYNRKTSGGKRISDWFERGGEVDSQTWRHGPGTKKEARVGIRHQQGGEDRMRGGSGALCQPPGRRLAASGLRNSSPFSLFRHKSCPGRFKLLQSVVHDPVHNFRNTSEPLFFDLAFFSQAEPVVQEYFLSFRVWTCIRR